MRKLEEIAKDIKEIDEKIYTLKEQRQTLVKESSERAFADFCEKYGVKKGDVVHTDRYGDVMIDGVDNTWYCAWIKVRKIKKNGEPYSVCNTLSPSRFEGCKVIGHKED